MHTMNRYKNIYINENLDIKSCDRDLETGKKNVQKTWGCGLNLRLCPTDVWEVGVRVGCSIPKELRSYSLVT